MAIANSIRQITQGFGVAGLKGAVATSTTITSNAVTATFTLTSPYVVNTGFWRLRVSNVDGSHAIASAVVTASDGTTTIYLDVIAIAGGVNGQGMDICSPFQSELNLKTFTAVVTGASGVTTMTVDLEAWGQENAGGP